MDCALRAQNSDSIAVRGSVIATVPYEYDVLAQTCHMYNTVQRVPYSAASDVTSQGGSLIRLA